jgi:hypothetical protein
MEETLLENTEKFLSKEQIESLTKYCSQGDLEKSFFYLHYNFGDGQVLTFEQIEAFLKSGLFTNPVMLQTFIDIIRMSSLLEETEAAPYKDYDAICESEEKLTTVHDELITKHKPVIDAKLAEQYLEAMVPYQKFIKEDFEHITVELISTLNELNHEGSFMNHCIATYYNIVINKQYVGFRITNNSNQARLTLGCIRHNDDLYFNQLKGWGNHPADKDSCVQVIKFCKKHHIQITEPHIHDLTPAFV